MTSKHYASERNERENLIQQIGMGKPVSRFLVDRHHKHGPEIHEIRSTGIIVVYNQLTKKIVTKLIARPGQIRRYYKDGKAPQALLDIAYCNTVINHYNEQKGSISPFFELG